MSSMNDLEKQIAQIQPPLRRFVSKRLRQTPLTDFGADGVDDVMQSAWMKYAKSYLPKGEPPTISLMISICCREIARRIRKCQAARRDEARRETEPVDVDKLADEHSRDPAQIVEQRDLIEKASQVLNSSERQLWDDRADQSPWPETSARFGKSVSGASKAWRRIVDLLKGLFGDLNETFDEKPTDDN